MPAAYLTTLRYWRDVEALTVPDLPRPGKRPQLLCRYGDALPWAATQATPAPAVHKYFAYFGLVDKRVLEDELAGLFGAQAQAQSFSGNHQRAVIGKTFLCAIEIGADGGPNPASLQVAAFCVAIAGRVTGAAIGHATFAAAFQERVAAIGGVVDAAWFEQVNATLIEALGWQPRQWPAREQLCLHKVALVDGKGKRLARAPELDPVNSFYLDDLERIIQAAENGAGAGQVRHYLEGQHQADARVDVTGFAALDAALAAQRFPAGRWPSQFPLFLMQQVAVNRAIEALDDGGIFSVNGPPGTGKTTLLMDVIAARLVARAELLARFDDPQQAFTACAEAIAYPANGAGAVYRGQQYEVDASLLDGGIVVASANNQAVENITLDLPSLEKVFPQPLQAGRSRFDYFAASAESILNEPPRAAGAAEAEPDDETAPARARLACWGLISVPLGNRKNRKLVAARLGRFGEAGLFKELDKLALGALDWNSARTAFYTAVARVDALQDAIARHDVLWAAAAEARAALALAQADRLAGARRQRAAAAALAAIEASTQDSVAALAANGQARAALARAWPWWRQLFARILRRDDFNRFQVQHAALAADAGALGPGRAAARRSRLETLAEAHAAAAALQGAEAALAAAKRALGLIDEQLQTLRTQLGPAAFDPLAFQALSVEAQQKSLPRSNPAYHAARAEVFVAAMHLHKAFLKNAGNGFRSNFQLALAMLEQQPFIQPHLATMAPHLWATFFLAVPVVSSTFASVARCFGDLGEGQIGLLLVDEAGQAVPSHALGAVWRARRVLMVGDPMQVEPVIKMDRTLDLAMLTYHGAPPQHLLTAHSAQHLADRGNRHGASVVQYDGSALWVGAPLRVHRRCVEPMFSLANRIAYNDSMVSGLAGADEEAASAARPLLGPSGWHDVRGADFDQHYSAAEGNAALAMVSAYARHGWVDGADGLPDLFLISPFKSVADELHSALRRRAGAWAAGVDELVLAAWLKSHVGTVHTFQGKQCESVVFVLGGGTAGARNWAGSRPNLINVAVTRAQRRLYVIGDRQAWSQTVFGKMLAEALPAIGPQAPPGGTAV
ncbi:DEAD/DEAH box helicase [Massilia sp. DWR3-1-1]|uniref:DEAD/DEAH box helicase n=1 Tax=Massilia sp. DWR3-1-1 TaxID=2804559 RepID=UPI003CF5D069